MRVGRGVSMPGEMLGRGQHAGRTRAANVCADQFANLLGILAERTCVDDRIFRIGIDVRYRKEIPMDPDCARPEASDSSKAFCVVRSTGRADRHRIRERGRPMQSVTDSNLELRRAQKRPLGIGLQTVEHLSSFEWFITVNNWR